MTADGSARAGRPIVIAHRGASGYLPEHTLVAKALAYGLGADYLEQDVVATRDAQLVVLHDIYLDDVSDVARRYPERRRDDGHYYVVDFDLAELRELNLAERRRAGTTVPLYPRRFPDGLPGLRVVTLHEELELVGGLNASTGRNVGVYPELKEPRWHHRHGIDLAHLTLAKLGEFGYRLPDSRAFVQCFDATELRRTRVELDCRLRLVQLVGRDVEHAGLLTAAGLRRVAEYADGLGAHYSQLLDLAGGRPPSPSALVAQARAAGLQLHAYTFRRDDLPPYATDLQALLRLFFGEVAVDGVFADHPDVAVRVRDALAAERVS
jgi:glycerophosphoryl diester phosphodiesterase